MKKEKDDLIFAGGYEYVPDKTYEAVVVRWERGEFYQRKKLYLWWRIVSIGPHEGKELFMAFNVFRKITKSSKYYQAWVLANKGVRPKKNDRMSPKIFRDKVFSIKTRTVVSGRKQGELDQDDRYAVVDEILELCAG